MVIGNNSIELYPKERVKLKVDAYCMNLSCGCAHGETMYLTDLYMTNKKVLAHQSRVWDYLDQKYEEVLKPSPEGAEDGEAA
mmetsp:Transcript_17405/g.36407  ORF Transcript_17405/g.36407 Transcript_17405/m.36407 type:complete len:82 (-) Transcript_17405:65-310(-)